MASKVDILVVDDEKEIRRLIKNKLTLYGYFVAEAENGYEALQRMKGGHYDLLLVDMSMPLMNGEEFIEKVREENRRVKIVVMSGHGDQEMIKRVMTKGIARWIVKPVKPEAIKDLIDELFK